MKKSFTTTITVNKSPKEVFDAITNVKDWWQGEIRGSSSRQGDEFFYKMNDIHFSKQKIVEFIPNKKITWLVTESNLSSFHDKAEWTNTKITFEISQENNKTLLRFTHEGLVPAFECYNDCSWAWGQLIQESLQSLITKGKGVNVFG